jgi:hypothetical protein
MKLIKKAGKTKLVISKKEFNKIAQEMQDNLTDHQDKMATVLSYYSVWTEEDVELGEASESGEDVDKIKLDEYDIEEGLSLADKIAGYLNDKGAIQPSSNFFHSGVWYTAEDEVDFRTGDRTERSYHIKDVNEETERKVFEIITKKGNVI